MPTQAEHQELQIGIAQLVVEGQGSRAGFRVLKGGDLERGLGLVWGFGFWLVFWLLLLAWWVSLDFGGFCFFFGWSCCFLVDFAWMCLPSSDSANVLLILGSWP